MEKSPNDRHQKEFWKKSARLMNENGLSTGEATSRLSLQKETLETWVRAAKEKRPERWAKK